MPTYRPLRPGDLLAVRSNDPYLDEIQVVIGAVIDNGATLLITGDWRGQDLEVLVRRVGDTHPQPLET